MYVHVLETLRNACFLDYFHLAQKKSQFLWELSFLCFYLEHRLLRLNFLLVLSQDDRTVSCLWVPLFQHTLCRFILFLLITTIRTRYPPLCQILRKVLCILRLPPCGIKVREVTGFLFDPWLISLWLMGFCLHINCPNGAQEPWVQNNLNSYIIKPY